MTTRHRISVAILTLAFGLGIAACTATTELPTCSEDVVLVGSGDYEDGQFTAYKCGPALDDFNKPTPTPQVITKTEYVDREIPTTPPSCKDALDKADDLTIALIDSIQAYIDEDYDTANTRAAEAVDHQADYLILRDRCLAN